MPTSNQLVNQARLTKTKRIAIDQCLLKLSAQTGSKQHEGGGPETVSSGRRGKPCFHGGQIHFI